MKTSFTLLTLCLIFSFTILHAQAPAILWQKCLGGSGNDNANSIRQTTDGGYVVAGSSGSVDGNVTGNHGGGADAWVVKMDSAGNLVWQKCYGGTGGDGATAIDQTSDGGYVVAGTTSSNDGDVSGWHEGYIMVDIP